MAKIRTTTKDLTAAAKTLLDMMDNGVVNLSLVRMNETEKAVLEIFKVSGIAYVTNGKGGNEAPMLRRAQP